MPPKRLSIEQRPTCANGHKWVAASTYERLLGTAFFEVDPSNPRNAIIVNLDKAPHNAEGKVEFSAPFIILKSGGITRGNGNIFYDINNRGNTDLGAGADHDKVNGQIAQQLRICFVLVDAGWHGDGVPNPYQLFRDFPAATDGDEPIAEQVRLEFSVATP